MSNTAWKKYYKPKYKVQQKNERSVLGLKPRIFLMVQSNSEYNKKKKKTKVKKKAANSSANFPRDANHQLDVL